VFASRASVDAIERVARLGSVQAQQGHRAVPLEDHFAMADLR